MLLVKSYIIIYVGRSTYHTVDVRIHMKKVTILLICSLIVFIFIIPSQATIGFSDSFNRLDGPLGENWTVVSGRWAVESEECSQDMECSWRAKCTVGDSICTDFIICTETRVVSGLGAGILFRYTDACNYYEAFIREDTDKAVIAKRIDGSKALWIKAASFASEQGIDYTFKLEVSGNVFKFYIDDVLVVEASDSDFGQGKIGLAGVKAHAHFDDVIIMNQSLNAVPEPVPLVGLTLCIVTLVTYVLIRHKPRSSGNANKYKLTGI